MRRVSLNDIARRLGVSKATVSYALRAHPSIPEATRERVRAAAAEMGYVPSSRIVELMRQIRSGLPPGYHGMIGLLYFGDGNHNAPRHGGIIFNQILAGAQERAAQLGYGVEPIGYDWDRLRPERLREILVSRGIRGVLLYQQTPLSQEAGFLQREFLHVALGQIHHDWAQGPHVQTNYPHLMRQALRRAFALGYRRPALILHPFEDRDTQLVASFLEMLRLTGIEPACPPLHILEEASFDIPTWFREYRPDCILGTLEFPFERLAAAGIEAPRDYGYFHCHLENALHPERFAGMRHGDREMGTTAVEHLTALLQRDEPPVQQRRHLIAVEGHWVDGPSVRRVAPDDPSIRAPHRLLPPEAADACRTLSLEAIANQSYDGPNGWFGRIKLPDIPDGRIELAGVPFLMRGRQECGFLHLGSEKFNTWLGLPSGESATLPLGGKAACLYLLYSAAHAADGEPTVDLCIERRDGSRLERTLVSRGHLAAAEAGACDLQDWWGSLPPVLHPETTELRLMAWMAEQSATPRWTILAWRLPPHPSPLASLRIRRRPEAKTQFGLLAATLGPAPGE